MGLCLYSQKSVCEKLIQRGDSNVAELFLLPNARPSILILWWQTRGNVYTVTRLKFASIQTRCTTLELCHGDSSHWRGKKTNKKSSKETSKKSATRTKRAIFTFTFIYPLNEGVVGAPQMTSQPVSSIFSLFSAAIWDLANSRPVHSLMLSSHLFFCLPLSSVPFHCTLQDGFGQTWWTGDMSIPLQFAFLFTIARRSSCGPIACWILAQTSSLVTWSLYEMRSILR